jgi:2-dehydropantoate 2-reductase
VGHADRGLRRWRDRGLLRGRLAQAGSDIHFIDRGAHLQALREHGLRVQSVKGDFTVRAQATDDPAEVGPCDYVLFCVKAFDTEAAAARLGPLLGKSTAVLSLQNGVDNEEKLAQAIGPDHVLGGADFIFAGKAAPGVIVHTGGPTSITFGELDGQVSERAQRLLACCQQAGFAAELSESIKTVLWAKFAFICAQAGMTAAVRLPIGELRTVDAAWGGLQRLVAEVAAADGSPIPAAAQQRALALAQSVEPGSFSSLHDDLVAGAADGAGGPAWLGGPAGRPARGTSADVGGDLRHPQAMGAPQPAARHVSRC